MARNFLTNPRTGLREFCKRLSTLNYDLIFEITARQLGIPVIYSATESKGAIRILKIHGSCNFWPSFRVGALDGVVFEGNKVDVEAPVVSLNQSETIYRCEREKGLAPAIAIYAEGKPVKVSPSIVEQQLKEWQQAVSEADKLIVIGVRVHDPDRHIWAPLSLAESPLWYMGLESDRDEFSAWKEKIKKTNAYFIEADFRKAISIIKDNKM